MADRMLETASLSEIDVLWITAGLGCDGETIAMTAATQPSIDDLALDGGDTDRLHSRLSGTAGQLPPTHPAMSTPCARSRTRW